MNIGLDIDGVLTDIHAFNRRHAPPYFSKKYGIDVVDESKMDIRDIFNCSEKEWLSYWKKYLLKYVAIEPARKGARDFTQTLRKDGANIFIISKRVFTCRHDIIGKLMRTIVKNWLWRNGIWYRDIVYCDNDVKDSKKTACLEKNVDVMIDDEPLNINLIAPIAKAICFDTSYNRECEGENIFRAGDFDEAYAIINSM